MAVENDFQVFAGAAGANVLTQAEWLALAQLTTGFESGILTSASLNKALRQASTIAALVAQFIADYSGQAVLDDGTIANKEVNLEAAIKSLNPPSASGSTYWPPLPSGNFHASGAASNALSTSASVGAANNMTLIPFIVPRACAVTEIGFFVSSSFGGYADAGIYSDVSGAPSALLASTGQISTGTVGMNTAAVSLTLQPGTPYWGAVAMTGASASIFAGVYLGSYGSQALGFEGASPTIASVALVQALTSGWTALPATAAPTGTATSAPVVFFNG